MSYQPRPHYDSRSPRTEHEHLRSPWSRDRPYQHPHPPAYPAMVDTIMDAESEDSDVSIADGDIPAFAFPINLPAAPSKQALERQETISSRLEELERVENHNIKKHDRLKEKRARLDDKIARKRAAQDAKIKVIMDARTRRDSRIKQRRDREDIAFQRFYEDLEDEENRLRQRLRKLKRGLPIDDTTPIDSRGSVNPMSPTGQHYSTVPPPAKRHQISHPSHTDSLPNRPPDVAPYAPYAPDRPQYAFYSTNPNAPPPLSPYHQAPTYNQPVPNHSPPMPHGPRFGVNAIEPQAQGPNGQISSSHSVNPIVTQPPPPLPTASTTPTNHPPPRQSSSSYDTRPPPPATSSAAFAAVNHPPPSGFAAVNSGQTATPPASHTSAAKEPSQRQHSKSTDHTPARTSTSEEKIPLGNTNKRTPSTTHPYQMSEAFANRHHHCERIDSLNRGIWTWYGPAGTQDHPTGPTTEMYLKCNHDACGRIDWRTVHGLQCHIVKNHEQPKGTIGSLEKALDKYGVPVKDIEEIERREGLGAGGTMADPKNLKAKSRLRESGDRRDFNGRDTPLSGNLARPYHSNGSDSPSLISAAQRPSSMKPGNPYADFSHESGTASTPIDLERESTNRTAGGFAAVNASWQGINSTPSKRPPSREQNPYTNQGPLSSEPVGRQPFVPSAAPAPFWSAWHMKSDTDIERRTSKPSSPIVAAPVPPAQKPPAWSSEKPMQASIEPEPLATKGREPQSQHSLDITSKSEMQQKDELNKVNNVTSTSTESKETEKRNELPDVGRSALMEQQVGAGSERVKTPVPRDQDRDQDQDQDRTKEPTTPNADQKGPAESDEISEREPNNTDLDLKFLAQSPEASSKRTLPSRRESRRTSIATATSSKAPTEKAREDDADIASATNTASKAESVDDDSDSITVNVAALKAEQKEREKEKEREDDKNRTTPAKRLANGRFTRRALRS